MKKLVLASVCAALPLSVEAADLSNDFNFIEDVVAPAPSIVGHLEFAVGWWHREIADNPQEDDAVRLEARGRVNIPFAGNWNLELEVGGDWLINTDDGISDADFTDIGAFAHLWVDLGGFRLGAFGGGTHIDNASEVDVWTGGAEAEIDVGNLTFGLQGSYNDVDCPSCEFLNIVGWADFYATPDTRLGVQAGYVDFIDIDSSTFRLWNVSGTAEHRFGGTPLSIFARAGYEASSDQVIEVYSVSGGLRLFFDNNALTLQEHDRQVPFEYRLPEITNSFGL